MERISYIREVSFGLLVAHFSTWIFLWSRILKLNVIDLTFAFCLDLWGCMLFLLVREKWLKGIGGLGMIVSGYLFFIQFKGTWCGWKLEDFSIVGVLVLNTLLLLYFLDKSKTQIK